MSKMMPEAPTFYSIGFFGAPNIGDELLCQVVADRIREEWPQCLHFVATADAEVSRRFIDARCTFVEGFAPQPEYLQNLFGHWRAARESNLVILGGGGLIGDRYSWASILRYTIDASLALALGRNFVMAGIGALEIRRSWLQPFARFLCRRAAAVLCRDPESGELVAEYGGRADIAVAPDLAHTIGTRLKQQTRPGSYALVNIRESPPIDPDRLVALCETLHRSCGDLVLLAAEPGEIEYLQGIFASRSTQFSELPRFVQPTSLSQAIEVIAGARVVVAERLHVNLLAAHLERPTLTLRYEDKVTRMMRGLGEGQLGIDLDEIGPAAAESAVSLPAPDWSKVLERRSEHARLSLISTIRKGLSADRPRLIARAEAAILFLAIFALTVVRGSLVVVKRAIWGRRRPRSTSATGIHS